MSWPRTDHIITHERRRGFQPPWYTVTLYRCPSTGRVELTLRTRPGRGGLYCPACGAVVPIA